LFFGLADVEDARSAFHTHDIANVPYFAFIEHTSTNSRYSGGPVPIVPEDLLSLKAGEDGAAAALAMLRRHGHDFVLAYDAKPWAPILYALAAFAAVAAWWVGGDVRRVQVFGRPGFWFVLSMTVYAVAVGGGVYCVIRTSTLYGGSGAGASWMSSDSRGQHILEGAGWAVLNLLAAAGVIMAVEGARRVKAAWASSLLVSLGVALFGALYWHMLALYQQKSGWYKFDTVWKGDEVLEALSGTPQGARWLTSGFQSLWQAWLSGQIHLGGAVALGESGEVGEL
jgi:hypothetical protein